MQLIIEWYSDSIKKLLDIYPFKCVASYCFEAIQIDPYDMEMMVRALELCYRGKSNYQHWMDINYNWRIGHRAYISINNQKELIYELPYDMEGHIVSGMMRKDRWIIEDSQMNIALQIGEILYNKPDIAIGNIYLNEKRVEPLELFAECLIEVDNHYLWSCASEESKSEEAAQ